MTPVIIFAAAVLFIAIVLFSYYNSIISLKNQAKRAWSDVLTHERLKIKLIPKLIEALEKYQAFEGSTFEKVTKLRSSVESLLEGDAINFGNLKQIQQKTGELSTILRATAENYPNLKSGELYGQLMQQLSEAEDNIAASLTIFNNGVQEFNNAIQTFPGSVVNSLLNKETALNEFTDTEAVKGFTYQPNF